MTGFGAKAYRSVAVESGVTASDPHQMVLMLYDGAIASVNQALGHLQAKRVAEKCNAIAKATRIIDEGLRISLDKSAGGQLAQRLHDLYEYMTMRLLQANLRNDAKALAEVGKLLGELRESWAQIGGKNGKAPNAKPAAAAPATAGLPVTAAAAAAAPARPASVAARFVDSALPVGQRRLATSA